MFKSFIRLQDPEPKRAETMEHKILIILMGHPLNV